jgi:hypothetical protein
MFDWFRLWQIGRQIAPAMAQGIAALLNGQAVEYSVPISVRGRHFTLTVRVDPTTGMTTALRNVQAVA